MSRKDKNALHVRLQPGPAPLRVQVEPEYEVVDDRRAGAPPAEGPLVFKNATDMTVAQWEREVASHWAMGYRQACIDAAELLRDRARDFANEAISTPLDREQCAANATAAALHSLGGRVLNLPVPELRRKP